MSRNNDGFKKSVFFHKDRFSEGGKLKAGPVWDFDWAWKNMWGCSIFEAIDGSGWAHHINDCPTDNYSCGYYIRLLQDSTFNAELRCTYEEYRQTIFDTTYIFAFMDSIETLVTDAQARHFKKWPILGISGPAPEVGAVATTYAAEMDTLKAWISERINWLDQNIPGLCDMTSSVTQHKGPGTFMTAYPNPGNGHFFLEGQSRENHSGVIEVYNALGQPVHQIQGSAGPWIQELYLELPGIYVAVLRDGSGVVAMTKILVQ